MSPVGDPLAHVVPGQPVRFDTRQMNAMLDACRVVRDAGKHVAAPRPVSAGPRWDGAVTIRNDSGDTRRQFDVLAIDGPLFAPASGDNHERTFKSRVVLKGITPGSSHYGRFAVLLEPVQDGRLARAQIDGVCPAIVKAADGPRNWADIVEGEHTLQAAYNGLAEILWAAGADEGQEMFAVLRLGRRTEPIMFGELLDDLHRSESATVHIWGFNADHSANETGRLEPCYDAGFIKPGFYLPADGRLVVCASINAEAPHWLAIGASICQEPTES